MTRNLALFTLAAALCAAGISPSAATERQDKVERNSERVMPFDMNATMHAFVPTSSGGMQSVVARDGAPAQVSLVRSHLRAEAAAFAHGEFRDPAAIHGGAMPGLAAMRAGAARMRVSYCDIPRGGRIIYTSSDPKLIRAIHAWFAAQIADHGAHATMRM